VVAFAAALEGGQRAFFVLRAAGGNFIELARERSASAQGSAPACCEM